MRDTTEVRQIVAEAMGIDPSLLRSDTVLSGDLVAIAIQVCMETGGEIILNQGDTWQNLLDQIL